MKNSAPSFLIAIALSTGSLSAQTEEENPADYRTFATDLPKAGGGGVDVETVESKIFEKANQFRKENEKTALERNKKLDAAALGFAEFMAETHRYGHTADGRRPSERVAAEDYDYCFVAENIAYEYRSESTTASALATRLLDGWIDSPGHRKNLLSEPATETGLGIARSEKTGAYFAVHLFARPKSKAIRFQVTNNSTESARYSLKTSRGEIREYSVPPNASGIHEECIPPQLKLLGNEKNEAVKIEDGEVAHIVSNGDSIALKISSD